MFGLPGYPGNPNISTGDSCTCSKASPVFETCLDVFAVVSPRWKLYSPEGDWTFEGDFDGRLLHAVLAVQRGVAGGRGYATEVPLHCRVRGRVRARGEGEGKREGRREGGREGDPGSNHPGHLTVGLGVAGTGGVSPPAWR